jgi:protein gp37
MARRLAGRCGYPEAPNHFDVTLRPDRLDEPLHWRKSRRVFVVSMGDLFHSDVPYSYINQVFEVMEQAPQHTFQVLTKRPRRMLEYLHWWQEMEGCAFDMPNVWLGVTAENQEMADKRVPALLNCPAAVRFVSCEPLLGEIDLRRWLVSLFNPSATRLDWVIVGGESGHGARPMHPDWARSLRDQCQDAGVAFFFKQIGTAWAKLHGCRDSHGGDMSEWPEDLRVREYPEPRRC